MKDWEEYSKDAMRTESTIEQVRLNPVFFLSVLEVAIAAGNMLDQMKKHAFYEKDYDVDSIVANFHQIVSGLDGIKGSVAELESNETNFEIDPRIFHAIVGISTESTELLEALDINGTNIDAINLLEESFDIDWYQFILMSALGGNLENVWDKGIEKLKLRYPDKFTNKNATNRDLDAERTVLDTIETSNVIKDIL